MDDEREGVLQVGEQPIVRRRDAKTEADHTEAMRAGRRNALHEVASWAHSEQERCGPYDDIRPYVNLRLYLNDLLRGVDDGA